MLLLDLAGPADMPSFVSWVHLLPAALEIIMWLDEKADTAQSEYLIASQARSLMNRLTRDLEAADIDIQHRQPAHGVAYLPIFAETSNALLARLRAAHLARPAPARGAGPSPQDAGAAQDGPALAAAGAGAGPAEGR